MSTDDQDSADALEALASAPIQVVAEIARFVLRADELVALRPGSILTVGPLRPTSVDVRIGDASWAHGELVNVDGKLGIRLISLARRPKAPGGADDADTLR